ncbi:MAG: sugar phosphate isomerase/epimerase [Eubacteriales bacterium]|nr:sugar phosphate isomerase/epimerase [Eubacteriales bacterium]
MKIAVFYDHIKSAVQQTGRPLEELLTEVRGMGIEGIECDAPETVEEARAFADQLRAAGLCAANVDWKMDVMHGQCSPAQLEAIAELGVRKALVIPGFIREGEALHDMARRTSDGLNALCDAAEPYGVTLTIEDMDNVAAPYATLEQVEWLLLNTPKLRCTFDTGNFLYSEENELQAFEVLASHIAHVHCKDRTFDANPGDTLTTVKGRTLYPVAVGHGRICMGRIIRQLQEIHYDDFVTIEHYGSVDQLGDMRRSAAWLTKALGKKA